MALSKKDEAGIQKHLEKFRSNTGVPGERNHYQCPLVQEILKDKKPILAGKVLVLGDYRMFIFEKAGQSGNSVTPRKVTLRSGLSKVGIKKKKEGKGSTKTMTSDQSVEEIAYFDILSIEHNKSSKFTVKVKNWGGKGGGKPVSIAFRTDSMPIIVEKICHLRHKMCGAHPPLDLVGPAMSFSEPVQPFVSQYSTHHYITVYPSWCNYYAGMIPSKMLASWISKLESESRCDLDLTEAPGFTIRSDQAFDIGPLVLSLAFDSYFKGLIVHDIPRKETIHEVAQVIHDNSSLAKIVLNNVDGESTGFLELGYALVTNKTHQVSIMDLANNKIGTGTDTLVDALRGYRIPLKYLNLSNCSIPAPNMKALFEAIASNELLSTKIEYLNVSHNKFDDEVSSAMGAWGLKFAKDAELRHLHLAGTNFNFNAIVKFKLLPKLITLDISQNKIDTELQLSCLWHFFDINPSVIKIDLSGCGFGQHPVLNNSAEFLQLLWSKIDILPEIELDLSNNPALGDVVDESLLAAQNLTKLDLSGMKLKLEQFHKITNVFCTLQKMVSLTMNNVLASKGDKAVGKSLGALVRSTHLAELNIAGGYGRVAVIELLEGISKRNSWLYSLDISNNHIGDVGAEALALLLTKDRTMKNIKLDGNFLKTNGWRSICIALYYNTTLNTLYWSSADIELAGRELTAGPKEQFYKILAEIQYRLQRVEVDAGTGFSYYNDSFGRDIPDTPGGLGGDKLARRRDSLTPLLLQREASSGNPILNRNRGSKSPHSKKRTIKKSSSGRKMKVKTMSSGKKSSSKKRSTGKSESSDGATVTPLDLQDDGKLPPMPPTPLSPHTAANVLNRDSPSSSADTIPEEEREQMLETSDATNTGGAYEEPDQGSQSQRTAPASPTTRATDFPSPAARIPSVRNFATDSFTQAHVSAADPDEEDEFNDEPVNHPPIETGAPSEEPEPVPVIVPAPEAEEDSQYAASAKSAQSPPPSPHPTPVSSPPLPVSEEGEVVSQTSEGPAEYVPEEMYVEGDVYGDGLGEFDTGVEDFEPSEYEGGDFGDFDDGPMPFMNPFLLASLDLPNEDFF